jgi:hypothetical protein
VTGRTVADIRADVATGHLSRLFAIGEIREVTGCGLQDALRILDGGHPRPRLRVAPAPAPRAGSAPDQEP